ncbi:2,3-diphosphoglycerate-dependent phosphoglycerate mutase [Candidatus Gracilibacteria bacterium]|nr:2,3-diphosphoglycerate-dependent phosphoglycerate mutase [Candidatus Gracilibacteria bacterium]
MYTLVIVRHAQSEWNKKKLFTGWTDVGLTPEGLEEARKAGRILKEKEFEFDLAYTSVLKRAIKTLDIILEETDQQWIPVIKHWRWNERHYGALQGKNKEEMAAEVGEEKVHIWRRSYDVRPPLLELDDGRYPGNDRRYTDLDKKDIPRGECLKDTVERFLPLWEKEVVPAIKSGKRIIISAHGNSLRALVKYLENISDNEISKLEIPTGIPLVYELDKNLKPTKKYYLQK